MREFRPDRYRPWVDDLALIGRADIEAARERLVGRVHVTPVFTAASLAAGLGCTLVLKAELFQRTGSFKARGALNRVLQLTDAERERGVISLSAGNHAAALAFAAREVGTSALIVMPATASTMKVAATQAYGGQVLQTADDLLEVTHREQAARGMTLVHPFDDREVIAGGATVGAELHEQAGDLDVVVVPVGGGGLISGVASAFALLRPGTAVIGVEPEGANGMGLSLRAGTPVSLIPVTVADGLAAPFAGALTLAHVQSRVERILEVPDQRIEQAMRLLYSRAKLAVEPSAAAGIAAVLHHPEVFRDRRVGVVVSGGNVAPELAARILAGVSG